MEKLFKLKAHGTDVKTEIRAGITIFFAMAYIIFVNSNYLSMTGMNKTGVMVATCISAAIGCLLTAFLANVPFCQAPGMGLNTFFTFTVCFAGLYLGAGTGDRIYLRPAVPRRDRQPPAQEDH